MKNYFFGDLAETWDPRKHRRIEFNRRAKITSETQLIDATTYNVSLSGIGFSCKHHFDMGKVVTMMVLVEQNDLRTIERVSGHIAGIQRGGGCSKYGLEFHRLLTPDQQPYVCRQILMKTTTAI